MMKTTLIILVIFPLVACSLTPQKTQKKESSTKVKIVVCKRKSQEISFKLTQKQNGKCIVSRKDSEDFISIAKGQGISSYCLDFFKREIQKRQKNGFKCR